MQATKLICPACAAKIQIARQLPVGARGRCPRCQTVFVVPEPEEPVVSPQFVDDEPEAEGEGRPRRKRRKAASSGGLMSYLALLIAGGLVLGFVVFMIWLFYYYAFPSSQGQDYIPTLPTASPRPSGGSGPSQP